MVAAVGRVAHSHRHIGTSASKIAPAILFGQPTPKADRLALLLEIYPYPYCGVVTYRDKASKNKQEKMDYR